MMGSMHTKTRPFASQEDWLPMAAMRIGNGVGKAPPAGLATQYSPNFPMKRLISGNPA
jgi:hypothetical protein